MKLPRRSDANTYLGLPPMRIGRNYSLYICSKSGTFLVSDFFDGSVYKWRRM